MIKNEVMSELKVGGRYRFSYGRHIMTCRIIDEENGDVFFSGHLDRDGYSKGKFPHDVYYPFMLDFIREELDTGFLLELKK